MAYQPPDLMSREIDEELRREQLLKLWDKYGISVLAAVLLIILAVGGWRYYQHQQVQANQNASTQYIVALGDLAAKRAFDARKRLEDVAATAPPGYAALARLRLAAYEGAQGSPLDAVNAYEKVAADETVDPILRDFARLQIAMLKFDAVPFSELRNQLTPLANERSPWRHSARELLGMGAMKAGFGPEARNHFQRLLADNTAPPGILERVRVMVAMLDEAERSAGVSTNAPSAPPSAEQKPETPSKAQAAEEKAETAPGKSE